MIVDVDVLSDAVDEGARQRDPATAFLASADTDVGRFPDPV